MEEAYKPNYYFIDELFISKIIFDKALDTDDVTIFGFYNDPYEEELQPVDYWCDFNLLKEMLEFGGKKGKKVLNKLSDKLHEEKGDETIMLDVEKKFGKPLLLTNMLFKVYKPQEKDDMGVWHENEEDNLFIIDSFELADEDGAESTLSDKESSRLAGYMLVLNNAYSLYLQLIKQNYSKKKARKMARLKDNMLFKIAELNYHMINKNGNEFEDDFELPEEEE